MTDKGLLSKEYRIEIETNVASVIEVILTEFMSNVFKEYYEYSKLLGESTDIVRISDNPIVYRMILYKSDNPMHEVRFEQIMKRIINLGRLTNCMDKHLRIGVYHDKWLTNTTKGNAGSLIRELAAGNKNVDLYVGRPKPSGEVSLSWLETMGLVGIYARVPYEKSVRITKELNISGVVLRSDETK